ncbi:HGGxSTG domain-containing protein [Paractinoplanes durhamensis]|uniref:Uncharacterized protein n=1 Tax=Paractinoplanes durhamensis TaxID=113563 RepID=A0ABQ3ZBT6_9ACTN|nr:HGGxSTG domain-containing protein [Actinoplanes durhamensis]GIE07294.1 hypothetical protein Adu01nite_86440 [Actinoplanes durhamensis]
MSDLSEVDTSRKCRARSKRSGGPCRNAPILGGTVCRIHGGAAPQTRAAAKARILAAADRAAAQLINFMESPDVPYPVRLAAARDLLDRADLTGKTTVEVSLAPWQEVLQGLASGQPAHVLPPGRDVIEGETA